MLNYVMAGSAPKMTARSIRRSFEQLPYNRPTELPAYRAASAQQPISRRGSSPTATAPAWETSHSSPGQRHNWATEPTPCEHSSSQRLHCAAPFTPPRPAREMAARREAAERLLSLRGPTSPTSTARCARPSSPTPSSSGVSSSHTSSNLSYDCAPSGSQGASSLPYDSSERQLAQRRMSVSMPLHETFHLARQVDRELRRAELQSARSASPITHKIDNIISSSLPVQSPGHRAYSENAQRYSISAISLDSSLHPRDLYYQGGTEKALDQQAHLGQLLLFATQRPDIMAAVRKGSRSAQSDKNMFMELFSGQF